jgi:hypothetical protein
MKYLFIILVILLPLIFLKKTKEHFFTNKAMKSLECMKLTNNDIIKIKNKLYKKPNFDIMEYIGNIAKEKGLKNEDIINCL